VVVLTGRIHLLERHLPLGHPAPHQLLDVVVQRHRRSHIAGITSNMLMRRRQFAVRYPRNQGF
jgi:hypothetical protein